MRVSELLTEGGDAQEWFKANKPETCPKCGHNTSFRDNGQGGSQVIKCSRCGKVHAERSYADSKKVTEAAKPKGTVDKNAGKERKPSKATEKSGFKVGQRVALYRGMGRTDHGNIHATGIKSGGDEGAMVHFHGGEKEYHPYSKLKDASAYWKDEQEKMYAERKKK